MTRCNVQTANHGGLNHTETGNKVKSRGVDSSMQLHATRLYRFLLACISFSELADSAKEDVTKTHEPSSSG